MPRTAKLGDQCVFQKATIAGGVVSQVVVRSFAREGGKLAQAIEEMEEIDLCESKYIRIVDGFKSIQKRRTQASPPTGWHTTLGIVTVGT